MDESLSREKELLRQTVMLLQEQKKKQTQGHKFNVFEICRIGSEETRHSAIIAALLDPKGFHGLGCKPLQFFLQETGLFGFADFCEDCEVWTEERIYDGRRRLDIIIAGHDLCIVIENKTGTVDHYRQLADYRDWLDKQKVSHKALLYLTYRGEPATEDISEDQYLRISYKKTLYRWLQHCACESGTVCQRVYDFFKQYADFIKNTLITGGKTMNQQELDNLLAEPENFFAAREIASRFATVQKEKFIQLFNDWAQDRKRPVKKIWRTLLTSDQMYDRLAFDSGRADLLIAFSFESNGFRNLCYGLVWADEQIKEQDHSVTPVINGWKSSSWWPYYRYFSGEYRSPIDHPEFLLARKEALYQKLDEAYTEMQDLISRLS